MLSLLTLLALQLASIVILKTNSLPCLWDVTAVSPNGSVSYHGDDGRCKGSVHYISQFCDSHLTVAQGGFKYSCWLIRVNCSEGLAVTCGQAQF